MANCNDLPKAVRERIYELHLVQHEPIDLDQQREITKQNYRVNNGRAMPPIITLLPKIEKEAAPFCYSCNHCALKYLAHVWCHPGNSWPRHAQLIRKITVRWDETTEHATTDFGTLHSYKGLEELRIRTDEKEMPKKMLRRSKSHQRSEWHDPTPQQQLAILRYPGMIGLLRPSEFPVFEFIKKLDKNRKEIGGRIPVGVFEAQVAPRIRGRDLKNPKR
jgi:hypothetical protein